MSEWIPIARPDPQIKQAQPPGRKPRRYLTTGDRLEMQKRAASGEPREQLAKDYDVAMATVNRVCAGIGRQGRRSGTAESPAEAPVNAPERPRVKTPDYVRRYAVGRLRELQEGIATKERQKAQLEKELEPIRKEFSELQAWLDEN